MGNVCTAGEGQAPTRQATLGAGNTVTSNKSLITVSPPNQTWRGHKKKGKWSPAKEALDC